MKYYENDEKLHGGYEYEILNRPYMYVILH